MAGTPSRAPCTNVSSTAGASRSAAAVSGARISGSKRGTVAVKMASHPAGEPAATCIARQQQCGRRCIRLASHIGLASSPEHTRRQKTTTRMHTMVGLFCMRANFDRTHVSRQQLLLHEHSLSSPQRRCCRWRGPVRRRRNHHDRRRR